MSSPAMHPALCCAAFVGAMAAFTAGCNPDMGTGCTLGYLGDRAQPMQLELFALDVNQQPVDLVPCGPIDIVAPPQGHYVFFVGVRATNIDACNVFMHGALRDGIDNSIDGLEGRSTHLEAIAGRPGWGQTAFGGDGSQGFSDLANIPACPSGGSRKIPQQAAVIQVDLSEVVDGGTDGAKKGSITRRVFPRCAQASAAARAACECECQADYMMNACVNVMTYPDSPDAGACFPASPPLDAGGVVADGDPGD